MVVCYNKIIKKGYILNMEKKCSNCGSKNLISANDKYKPFGISGDANLNIYCDVYLCIECGHYEFFSESDALNYKREQESKNSIVKEIEQLNEKILDLQNKEFDPKPFENKIKQLENEINTLESLSVGGKDIRWREDAIKENKKILKERIDPNVEKEINNLNNRIHELKKQAEKL